MKREGKVVLAFMVGIWITMPLYILLHEGGHVLVAWSCGAKITAFNILEGYVVAEGGNFNEITLALFYAAGVLVPMIGFTSYLMLHRRRMNKVFYTFFSAIFSVVNLFSMGVWMIVPIQYMMGIAKPNDDVTKLIEVLKIDPLIVMILAGIVMCIYSLVIWKKGIFQDIRNISSIDENTKF